jgi:hypothetical protein
MMSKQRVVTTLLVGCLALGLAACGGGGNDPGPANAAAQGDSSGGVGIGDALQYEECIEVARAFAGIAGLPMLAFSGASGQELADIEDQLSRIEGKVPPAIADAYAAIESALEEFAGVLDGASISDVVSDPSLADRMSEASEVFKSADVEAAFDEITAYFEANCEGY